MPEPEDEDEPDILSTLLLLESVTANDPDEPEPEDEDEPDMLSTLLLLASVTANDPDELRTAAATANEPDELKSAADKTTKSKLLSRNRSRPNPKSDPEPESEDEDEHDMLSTLLLLAPATTTANEPNELRTAADTANEPDELKADPIEESRDDQIVSPAFAAGVACRRFVNKSSTVLFGAVSEAQIIADDITNIVAAKVEDWQWEHGQELESAIQNTQRTIKSTKRAIKSKAEDFAAEVDDWRSEHHLAEEWSVAYSKDKKKGGKSKWAKEIKKLGKLQRTKEKAVCQIKKRDKQITEIKRLGQLERNKKQIAKLEKQITKYENIVSVAQREQEETLKNVKCLPRNRYDDDFW